MDFFVLEFGDFKINRLLLIQKMLIKEVDLQKSWVPGTYGINTKEAP